MRIRRCCVVTLVSLASLLPATLASAQAPANDQPDVSTRDDATPPAYKLAKGGLATSVADLTLTRDGVEVPIRVRFPTNAPGPVPLVLFSHGMGGSFDSFSNLTEHWASHGYVVILPTHADSIKRQREQGRDPRDFARDPEAYRARVDLVGRVDDLKAILDSLATIEEKIPALRTLDAKPLIDRERIGVAGHSAGAFTAQLCVDVKVRTRSALRGERIGDSRFDAAIIISGQGTTSRNLMEDSWKGVTRPMLVIAGSKDVSGVGNETPESRRHPYELSPSGDKYLLFIEGATHSSYQGKDGEGRRAMLVASEKPTTDIAIIADAVAAQTLAFLDAYLKGDAAAKDYLARDHVRAIDKAIHAEHK